MRKDYAKKTSRGKKVRQKKSAVYSSWRYFLVILICCVVGVFGYGFYYLQQSKKSFADILPIWLQHKHQTPSTKKLNDQTVQADNSAKNSIKFDFYDALPSGQSILNVTPAKSISAPAPAENSGYFLTFGEFSQREEAARVRLSLLLNGVDSKIIKIKNADQVIWRLQKGPFSNKKTATRALARLKQKGIESHLLNMADKVDKKQISPI